MIVCEVRISVMLVPLRGAQEALPDEKCSVSAVFARESGGERHPVSAAGTSHCSMIPCDVLHNEAPLINQIDVCRVDDLL